ncbi:hypothetical protein C8A00DRAFT_19434 [Chaetomidium leptoderma]|uniref:Uncharacterized protein n=1 Tax=Chaetomidium leptoderma TaxID=669021 RepID=A0AAN6VCJ1_9PEZI|nr:hypothetical protein C8A00DRAFT_19434 [Chaetomidium leptoderma]
MCSFILQRDLCKECRSPIGHEPVDHRRCGKPPKKCPGNKKRGTTVRYVKADECNRCSLKVLEAELLEQETVNGAEGELDSHSDDSESELPPTRPMQLGFWM